MKFESFSAQAFECLAQALSIKVLGPGTVIFGSGPDGAREATFEGEVPFPSTADRWKGYIVVQAKCREKLKNNQDDATWLCTQLTKDLKKFEDKKRALRKPDYFLLISNVSLSSVAKSGGKAKVEFILQKYSKKFGMKGFAVWAADELRALLDDAESIRRAYTAWLTPNEVLAELVTRLARPNLTKLLPLSLARDLRDERDVRLKDAGQETDKAIYLEQVFIDLPLVQSRTKNFDSSREEAEDPNDVTNIVARIVRRSADKLDPVSIDLTKIEGRPLPNRIVILGGPGQGKSTLGQFLVQYERARLLSSQKKTSLTPQTRDLLNPIFQRASSENLSNNGPLRFPIRVSLPDFANALEDGGNTPTTLLSFISCRLSREIDVTIVADDLRHWLGSCPSLLVLDGLDEVPPTANRRKLIAAIEGFWDDLHLVNADSLVVVTTRPQGYNQDLDPNYWTHWDLAPLSIPYVVRFASRLCEVRVSEKAIRTELIEQIKVAANEDSTKALVSSPLQVAIMFGIILLKGAIPKDRWDLFDRYYSLMRDREAQKPASIVRDFKRQIDVLHQEVGFLLHVSAEDAGKSVAYVTEYQLASIIERTLVKEEFSSVDVKRISSDLSRAATHRLVFLNARIVDQITFDVRSLQEFMAASQITSASPVYLIERLRAISTSSHWRNVFRIAASKIFSVADFGHYRGDVVGICHALDSGEHGEQYRLVRAGATLALELLVDGVAASAPRFKKALLRRAFSLLDISGSAIPEQLVGQLIDENLDIISEEVEQRLQQGKTIAANGALRLLFEGLRLKRTWAEVLLLKYWPVDPSDLLEVLPGFNLSHVTDPLIEKIRETQWLAGPRASQKFLGRIKDREGGGERGVQQQTILSVLPPGYQRDHRDRDEAELLDITIVPGTGGEHGFSTRIISTAPSEEFILDDQCPRNLVWEPLLVAAEFCRSPSKETLSLLFEKFPQKDCDAFSGYLPWVVGIGQRLLWEGMKVTELVDAVRSGLLGDRSNWAAAEQRWGESGLTAADFLVQNEPNFLGNDIGRLGAPHLVLLSLIHQPLNEARLQEFCGVIARISVPSRQAQLLGAAFFMRHSPAADASGCFPALINVAVRLLASLSDRHAAPLAQSLLESPNSLEHIEFVEYLDRAGKSGEFGSLAVGYLISRKNEHRRLIAAISKYPEHRGLLVHLAKCVMRERGAARKGMEIGRELLIDVEGDGDNVRWAISVLKIVSMRWSMSDIARLVEVFTSASLTRDDCGTLLSAIEGHEDGLSLLIKIEQENSRDLKMERYATTAVLRRVADAKRSVLSDANERARLDLPSAPDGAAA
jgi:hypothetical protein